MKDIATYFSEFLWGTNKITDVKYIQHIASVCSKALKYSYRDIALKFLQNPPSGFLYSQCCFLPIHSWYRNQSKFLESKVDHNIFLVNILQWCSIAQSLDKPIGWIFAPILLQFYHRAMLGMRNTATNKTKSLSCYRNNASFPLEVRRAEDQY